jgi:hypothetical protein
MNNSAASSVDFKKQFALFLLHLREKSKLPSNAVVAVAKEIIDMLGYHHAEVSDNIIKYQNITLFLKLECLHQKRSLFL